MLSPGVPLDLPELVARARGRRAGDRRAGAGLALAARPDRRHHRHQGQVDDHHARRADARGGGPARARRRQHRRAAQRPGGRRPPTTPCTWSRRAAFSSKPPTASIRGSPRSSTSRRTTSIGIRRCGLRGGQARVFANQTAEDWAVVNADERRRRWRWRARAARGRSATRSAPKRGADVFADRGFIWQRTSDGDVPLVPLSAVRLAGAHLLSNVVAASAISSLAGADGAAMARALDGFTGLEHVMEPVGHDRRRALRQRLEGDQRRCGRAIDRELRLGGRDRRRQVQGRRPARSGAGRSRRTAGRWSPSARRGRWCARRSPARCRWSRRSRWPKRCARAWALARPGRRGAAGAGVRELRHVRGLRGPRAAVQGGGATAGRGGRGRRVSSEQSSVGWRRVGAGRWERRLPRSARLVSHSRN